MHLVEEQVSVSDMVSLMLLSKSCSRSTVLFDPPPERLCAGRKELFVLISSIDRSHTLGVLLGMMIIYICGHIII